MKYLIMASEVDFILSFIKGIILKRFSSKPIQVVNQEIPDIAINDLIKRVE